MKIALGQINPVIGDFAANRRSILSAAAEAAARGARMIVFPELALCGYPPMDLLEHHSFLESNLESLRLVQHELPRDIAAVVGYVAQNRNSVGKPIHNAAAVLLNGQCIATQAKTLLPTYDVFDEARYFEPADSRTVFTLDGHTFGIAICEDLWWETEPVPGTRYPVDPVRDLLDQGARTILCPSASPFVKGKIYTRQHLIARVGAAGASVVYCNMTGANDNLIFDGRSMVSDETGTIRYIAEGFKACVPVMEIDPPPENLPPEVTEDPDEVTCRALVTGIRDYLRKTGFRTAHIGLSGGIDSAIVAVLAAWALGPENLTCFLLPSRYSSDHSILDAARLASNLGCTYHTIPIEPSVAAMEDSLSELFSGTTPDTTEENIQARVRGNILMAFSNKFHSLLLTTGNKSELAVGYCTLYGDMCGSLSVIGDLLKTEVYQLCNWINRDQEIIPANILTKPPSAELRPDQTDQDSLPEYHELDAILSRYLMQNRSARSIISEGFDAETVHRIVQLTARAEYKRRQAPPVLKISEKAFGTGRRIPIARALFETDG
ncbi:NAD+ synthase [Spirochaeta africana]|uniref:Glutamine-dependent NAD(+) synthetase n=1 Tax=Spirochaeta africana (strain ATCC 700263 / DSM 8902 / Z-7692) TaxID=889378 RepID=H9UMT6_SPIAZ|nr:NAD+ synthase [Spirochaeta africana]AFG38829.1 NAD synthase [Spirochaeta africana DSM 8902]